MSTTSAAIVRAFMALGRYDHELLRELDYYLLVAEDLFELHDLIFRRVLEETTAGSPALPFWVSLRGSLADMSTAILAGT